ncbi:MAG: preprotein translocase subunit YajC [Gemmatimonadota bacterium]|nr:preprotein translocase subunit YajC [Gemmatimonadota bacterium]
MIINILLVVAIFYFLLILPQRREQKRHAELLAALRPGDSVATIGGIVGEIVQLGDSEVTLRTGDSKVVVERTKITRVIKS